MIFFKEKIVDWQSKQISSNKQLDQLILILFTNVYKRKIFTAISLKEKQANKKWHFVHPRNILLRWMS